MIYFLPLGNYCNDISNSYVLQSDCKNISCINQNVHDTLLFQFLIINEHSAIIT